MQELIKNIFYLGAGAAFATKEKINEVKNELVEKGKLTQEEGRQFVDELLKKSEQAKEDLEKKVNEAVTEQLAKMNVATRDDVDTLRKQVEELRELLEAKGGSDN